VRALLPVGGRSLTVPGSTELPRAVALRRSNKRPKRLVSYIPDLPYPVNYLSWKTYFVLFYFFIKPTVTGEMAMPSSELSRVTGETRQGPLGPRPCQNLSDARASLRRALCSWTPLWHLTSIATGGQAPVPHLARLRGCTLPVDSKRD